jgi:micrococcal nuclease
MTIARKIRLPIAASLVVAASTLPALAASTLDAKVKAVSDGDTLVIGGAGRTRVVQLAGIDAPEITQEFGRDAGQLVRKLTHGKRVTVEVLEQSSPESIVARVTVDGKDLAVTLIEAGLAWAVEGSPAELRTAQEKAKSGGLGLWASATPTPPWEYRNSA